MSFRQLDEKIKIGFMLVILFIINLLWFHSFKYHTLMGDDLNSWNNFKNYSHSAWHYVVMQVYGDKYRPVFNLFQYTEFKLFGTQYSLFYYVNILLNFIIACVLFKIIKMVTKGNIYISFLFSILYLTSRFAYYNVLQLFGTMEALAVLFLLMIVFYSILFYTKEDARYLYWVIFYDLLIVLTHERYLALTPFIILLIFLRNGFTSNIRPKVINSVIAAMPFLFYIAMKMFVLNAPVLAGTGGTYIDFNISRMVSFFKDGLLNMFGINIGPEYLSGIAFHDSSSTTKITSIVIAILILLLLILHVRNIFMSEDRSRKISIGILFVSVIGLLLLAASITIRQEFRWLYDPYVIVLIFVAYMLNQSIKVDYFKYAVLLLLVAGLIRNDVYIKQYAHNVFFVYSQDIAESAYVETIQKYGSHLNDYQVYMEKNDQINWPLQGSLFFQTHTGENIKINYVDHLPNTRTSKDIMLKLDWPNKKIVTVK